MEPIRLTFLYTEQDFTRAYRLHFRHKLRLKTDIALIIVLSILGAFLWRSPEDQVYAIVAFCSSSFLALMLFTVFVIIPKRIYRREPKHRDECSLAFSSDGIQFHTAHIDSNIAWSLYSHAIINSNTYNLYYGHSSLSIIPMRVFVSIDQKNLFDQLIPEKIPKITRQS